MEVNPFNTFLFAFEISRLYVFSASDSNLKSHVFFLIRAICICFHLMDAVYVMVLSSRLAIGCVKNLHLGKDINFNAKMKNS